jgi:hypothetical protein
VKLKKKMMLNLGIKDGFRIKWKIKPERRDFDEVREGKFLLLKEENGFVIWKI